MSEARQSGGANADQADYWNSGPGQKWITFQESLDQLFLSVNERLLARAAPRPGDRLLDIGCGTGATTMAFAAEVGAQGSVVGVDISGLLLERATARKTEGTFDQVAYILADAQTHAFESGAFDLVLSRFGVMFFNDPVAAFRNLAGALRPGGRLCFASWASLSDNPWFEVPRNAAARRLGRPAPVSPKAPGPLAFAETDYVLGILKEAGYGAASAEVEQVGLFDPGGVETAAFLASNIGPSARIVKEFKGTAEDVAEIGKETAKGFQRYAVEGGACIPATLNFFTALKP